MENLKVFKGFTLLELAIVIVVIGVVAAFTVPRFRDAVERSKAAESFNYLSAVQTVQERYHARQGNYADSLDKIDIQMSLPKYFSVGSLQPGSSGSLEDSWSLTLTRKGTIEDYGAYTVTFTDAGYDSKNSTIQQRETINPMAT